MAEELKRSRPSGYVDINEGPRAWVPRMPTLLAGVEFKPFAVPVLVDTPRGVPAAPGAPLVTAARVVEHDIRQNKASLGAAAYAVAMESKSEIKTTVAAAESVIRGVDRRPEPVDKRSTKERYDALRLVEFTTLVAEVRGPTLTDGEISWMAPDKGELTLYKGTPWCKKYHDHSYEKGIYALWAAAGTGKSEKLIDLIIRKYLEFKVAADKLKCKATFLYVSHRRTLAKNKEIDIGEKLRAVFPDFKVVSHIDNREDKIGELDADLVIISPQKLRYLTKGWYYSVILDEFTSIMAEMSSCYHKTKAGPTVRVNSEMLIQLVRGAHGPIFCMDQNFDERFTWFCDLNPTLPVYMVRNTAKIWQTKGIRVYMAKPCKGKRDIKLAHAAIRNDLIHGKNLVIVTQSVKEAEHVLMYAKDVGVSQDEILYYSGERKDNQDELNWINEVITERQPRILMYSQVMTAGVNISVEHFDKMFVIYNPTTSCSRDLVQQMCRVRWLRDNLVWIVGRSTKGTAETNLRKLLDCRRWTRAHIAADAVVRKPTRMPSTYTNLYEADLPTYVPNYTTGKMEEVHGKSETLQCMNIIEANRSHNDMHGELQKYILEALCDEIYEHTIQEMSDLYYVQERYVEVVEWRECTAMYKKWTGHMYIRDWYFDVASNQYMVEAKDIKANEIKAMTDAKVAKDREARAALVKAEMAGRSTKADGIAMRKTRFLERYVSEYIDLDTCKVTLSADKAMFQLGRIGPVNSPGNVHDYVIDGNHILAVSDALHYKLKLAQYIEEGEEVALRDGIYWDEKDGKLSDSSIRVDLFIGALNAISTSLWYENVPIVGNRRSIVERGFTNSQVKALRAWMVSPSVLSKITELKLANHREETPDLNQNALTVLKKMGEQFGYTLTHDGKANKTKATLHWFAYPPCKVGKDAWDTTAKALIAHRWLLRRLRRAV